MPPGATSRPGRFWGASTPAPRAGTDTRGRAQQYTPPRVSPPPNRLPWLTPKPISHAAKNLPRGSDLGSLAQVVDDKPENGEDEDARLRARVTGPDGSEPGRAWQVCSSLLFVSRTTTGVWDGWKEEEWDHLTAGMDTAAVERLVLDACWDEEIREKYLTITTRPLGLPDTMDARGPKGK